MLDIRLIRDEPELVRRGLTRRGEDPAVVDRIAGLDAKWRSSLVKLEALRAERNTGSKAIATVADEAERAARIAAMRDVGQEVSRLESEVAALDEEVRSLVMTVPNIPAGDVPDGASEEDNPVVRSWGDPMDLGPSAQPHWDLGPALGIIDFERGVRLSGSRFYVLVGAGARLQRALIDWMLESHINRGYTEVYPPALVREACMWNAGQLPKFVDNLYRDVEDDLWLVPTAEVPLTNYHAGEILDGADLPIRYAAYTPCFRREKMSAGRDVRGIKRGHQFDKVELYHFTLPDDSPIALQAMLADAEALLQALQLPYRVKELCTADLGFNAAKTYDLEVWAAGCREWLEVSSVSNVTDFQARRAGIRFRPTPGAAPQAVHTLNGSGLALPRTLIAVLENNQQPDGSITIPPVLASRMGAASLGAS